MTPGWLHLLGKLRGCALRADPATLRATFADEAAAALTGHSVARWLADPPLLPELLHPEDREATLTALAAAAAGHERVIEHRLFAKGGRAISCRTAARRGDDGLELVILDVASEQRARTQAESAKQTTALLVHEISLSLEELQHAQAALVKRERLAALGELASVIAHEVRNPLGAIFNSLGALRKMVTLEGEAALLFQILEEEASRLNRITVDLLDWVRPMQPMVQLQAIGPVIQEALRTAERLAQLNQVRVQTTLDLDPALPLVLIDEHLLHLALMNVLANGLQSMPRGGRLVVSARPVIHGARAWIAVAVTDTGPGIAPEVIGRIFEPFFTTRASGTGLGLALVKRIIESHGGEVDVESRPGEGATFLLRLSLAPDAA